MTKNFFGWMLFIALAIILFGLLNKGTSQYASIPIDEFTTRLKENRVRVVTVETDRLLGEFREPVPIGDTGEHVQRFQVALPAGTTQNWTFMQWLLDNRQTAMVRVENNSNWITQLFIPLVPWLLIFGFIWFFVFRKLRGGGQTSEIKPWPVYIVPSPQGQPMPAPPLAATATPPPPSTHAPGGDN